MTDYDDIIVPKYRPLFRSLLAEAAERMARPLVCYLLSYRVYGQPKIHKPKCLKGLSPAWTCKVLGRVAKVFERPDGALVVYFGALFCKPMVFPDPKDMALPTAALVAKYPERFGERGKRSFKDFIYADAWCPIYERNEGYVVFEGVRERCEDYVNCYTPSLSFDLFAKFAALSREDRGFCDISVCDDDIAAHYRRFVEDLVSHYYCAARDAALGRFRLRAAEERERRGESAVFA